MCTNKKVLSCKTLYHILPSGLSIPDLFTPSPSSMSESTISNYCHEGILCTSTPIENPDEMSSDSEANSSNPQHIEFEVISNDNIQKGDLVLLKCDINTTTMCVTSQQLIKPHTKCHKVPNRTRRDCPYKGCSATHLAKLSNHLRQMHGLKNPVKIQKYLKQAKLVCVKLLLLFEANLHVLTLN